MSAMYFRPVVTYPTRCVAPAAFFTRPAPVAHNIVPLFSLLDESLTQLDNHLRQAQRQFKRPFNPKFDVKESKEAYSLEGELPGFDAKDISIEFLDDGHTLRIKGRTVKEAKSEKGPAATESGEKAVADTPAAETPAETAEASKSETSSVKSHQATVEDEVEEPANASATATTTTTEQAVAETPKAAEQQVTEAPKKTEEAEKKWVSERYTGSFTRSFRFPSKVDQEAVKASLKDGILAITLPFARKPESRKIQIE